MLIILLASTGAGGSSKSIVKIPQYDLKNSAEAERGQYFCRVILRLIKCRLETLFRLGSLATDHYERQLCFIFMQ
jgi:hypothetical protein